jgi:hypothetical protein
VSGRLALLLLFAGVGLGACRFGGPSLVIDAGSATDDAGMGLSDDGAGEAGADGAQSATADGGSVDDANGADGAGAGLDAGSGDQGGACGPAAPPGTCDPVQNVGCSTLLRCDVGPTPGAGQCVGIWISGEGTACWRDDNLHTDPCATHLTCAMGRCKKLCWCDADCGAGRTCSLDAIATGTIASGFKLCQ